MRTIGKLLSSAAQTEIMRALLLNPRALGLRQAARIAGVHPHSAELALAALSRNGLVNRRRMSNRVLYEVQRTHPDVVVLDAVFEAAAHAFIRTRAPALNARARSLLPFFREVSRMIQQARGVRHAT